MPLFRQYRGSLAESLKNTHVVKNRDELIYLISFQNAGFCNRIIWDIKIEPHMASNNFDARIEGYTHLVLTDMYEKGVFQPVGFLSGSLN